MQHVFASRLVAAISMTCLAASLLGVVSAQSVRYPQHETCDQQKLPEVRNNPPAPRPEPIQIVELPLPPTAPSDTSGACTIAINPHRTGCLSGGPFGVMLPAYMWDGHHVLLNAVFSGAPTAPDPAGIYSGMQVIVVKTDGTLFANGDAWKCLTCGIPAANKAGMNPALDHPQAFHDGKRALAGMNILDCSPYRLTETACTAAKLHVYPIWWNTTADGNGRSGYMREIRLNPDDVHLGWSHPVLNTKFEFTDQYGYMGRLEFNAAPAYGTPRTPRYELNRVTTLFSAAPEFQLFRVDPAHPGELLFNYPAGAIGEFRGWTSDGREALGISVEESGNWDGFATSLATGQSRRLSRDPAYTDPMKSSPDDKWTIVMDTRDADRMMWVAGMRGVPPLSDLLTTAQTAGVRNNGERRFFQPFLIDRYGDRGNYHGQQLNAGDTSPGGIGDPNWNGESDPAWSPDGTEVIYWQSLVTAPACGGVNPLPCPVSTEPGGRRTRLMIAHLTSRRPLAVRTIAPVSDEVSWGLPYHPGDPYPVRPHLASGLYILRGHASGVAQVEIKENETKTQIASVIVRYDHYSDDGFHVLDGTESVETIGGNAKRILWHSNLKSSGCQTGTKITSEPAGFTIEGINFEDLGQHRLGTLTTTLDGKIYVSPAPGT